MSKNEEIKKVRVRPYPINCSVEGKTPPVQIRILRLNEIGFIAEIGSFFVSVQEKLVVQFELPVFHHAVRTTVVAVKTYDRLAEIDSQRPLSKENSHVIRIAEFQYKIMRPEDTEMLKRFLIAIRQVKAS